MEVDSFGRMWIIDTGNTPNVTAVPVGMQRTCPPRIVIVNISTAQVIVSHTFVAAVADPAAAFLNDIVLDQRRGLAYISITWGDGGIIVYSLATNSARFFSGESTKVQPFAVSIIINGLNYNFSAPSDTIALSPDTQTLYYGALGGFTMFSVPTSVIANFSASIPEINAEVRAAFNRSSANGALTQCDGMTTSAQGSFFYGSFGNSYENSIVQRFPNGAVVTLYDNADTMQWVDTLGWAGPEQLIFTTNRLQKYFAKPSELNFSDTNFRVFRLRVPGQTSYLQGQMPPPSPSSSSIASTVSPPSSTTSTPPPPTSSLPPPPPSSSLPPPPPSSSLPPPPPPSSSSPLPSPPPSTPNPSDANSGQSLKPLSSAEVAGISIGIALLLVLIICLFLFRQAVVQAFKACFQRFFQRNHVLTVQLVPGSGRNNSNSGGGRQQNKSVGDVLDDDEDWKR